MRKIDKVIKFFFLGHRVCPFSCCLSYFQFALPISNYLYDCCLRCNHSARIAFLGLVGRLQNLLKLICAHSASCILNLYKSLRIYARIFLPYLVRVFYPLASFYDLFYKQFCLCYELCHNSKLHSYLTLLLFSKFPYHDVKQILRDVNV